MNKQVMLRMGLAAGFLLAFSGVACAVSPWQLLGSGVPVKAAGSPTHWAIAMFCEHGSPSGGIEFNAPPGKLTFAGIKNLSVDYRVNNAKSCSPDSPRLLLELDSNGDGMADKDMVVYLGPPPELAACAKTWTDTGNLVHSTAKRFDTRQFHGGTAFDSYADAVHLAGKDTVVAVLLLVDGGAGDLYQDILVDKLQINHFQLNAQSFSQ